MSMDFDKRLRALRLLNTTLGTEAEKLDNSALEDLTRSFRDLIPTENPKSASTEPDAGSGPVERRPAVPEAEVPTTEETESLNLEALIKDPRQPFHGAAKELVAIIFGTYPARSQGDLLRQSGLMSLESTLANLFADLWCWAYRKWPDRLPTADKSFSLAALKQLGSVEAAEDYLLENRIEKHLRESLSSQLQVFKDVDLSSVLTERPRLVEISLRRNLFVHNDGIVNRLYLERHPPDLSTTAKEGDRLQVTKEYFAQAIDTFYTAGVIISHLCWVQWAKEERSFATAVLHHLLFESLRSGDHAAVERLARFALGRLTSTDPAETRHVVTVNLAIAVKAQGRAEEANEIMTAHDWSGTSLKFDVARNLIAGNRSLAIDALRRAVAAKEIDVFDLDRWPIFSDIREEPEYQAIHSTSGTRSLLAELLKRIQPKKNLEGDKPDSYGEKPN